MNVGSISGMVNGTCMCDGPTCGKKVKAGKGEYYNTGGYLHGPTHEHGGIPANVNGTPIELEGGEYIINAQTVGAVGTEFLDELNSTQTEYWEGGFGQGVLPTPSMYQRGGRTRKNGKRWCVRHRMPDGTIMSGPVHGPGQTCVEWSDSAMAKRGGRLQRGGRTRKKPKRKKYFKSKMQTGGTVMPITNGTSRPADIIKSPSWKETHNNMLGLASKLTRNSNNKLGSISTPISHPIKGKNGKKGKKGKKKG